MVNCDIGYLGPRQRAQAPEAKKEAVLELPREIALPRIQLADGEGISSCRVDRALSQRKREAATRARLRGP